MLAEKLTTEGLSRGYRGTAKTIKRMHKLVAKGKLDPSMHEIATLIRLSVPEDRRGSTKATADAIYFWVKKHGVFQRDPFQIERIDHPVSSMKAIIGARQNGGYNGPGLFVGDCDTFSIWVATLGGLLGFNYAFETAKVDPIRPDEFSHVWTALRVGQDWIAYDASTPSSRPGWRPPISSPDQFARWPEQAIEDTMGMGEDILPMDYFGNGTPREFDFTPPEVVDVDPGRLELLIPTDTQPSAAEMEFTDEPFIKEIVPGADARPSLKQGDEVFDTGPRYSPGPEYYKQVQGPYPVGSRWNRIRYDKADKSMVPKGSEFHVSPSTVNARDVDIVDGVSVPVSEMREENMGSIASTIAQRARAQRAAIDSSPGGSVSLAARAAAAQRQQDKYGSKILRRGKGVVMMRPRRFSAGMGQDPYGAEPGGAQYQQEQAAAAPVTSAASSVMEDISKVLGSVLPSVATVGTAAINAKYQTALANATARLTGGAMTPAQVTRAITPAGPWYTQTWVLLGGGIAALGLGYVVMSSMGGKKRRRR